jgi:hypothetical protein
MRVGVLAICLLLLTLAAPGVAADPGENESVPGDLRTLGLDEDRINRSELATVGPALGATLARDADRLKSRHRSETVATREAAVADDSARFDILDAELTRIEEQIEEQAAAERRIIREFDRGERSTTAVALRLARVRSTALGIRDRLSRIRTSGRQIDSRAIVARSDALSARASRGMGPVRAEVARTTRGEQGATELVIESAGSGSVIALTGASDYKREVSVPGRTGGPGTVIQLPQAIEIVRGSYPEAWDNRRRIEDTVGGRRAGLYRITVVGSGRLEAFVGLRSRQVFTERRTYPLALLGNRLPDGAHRTDGDGELRLSTKRTYHGGPLPVSTTDPESGDAIDARITVDGTAVGRTGADGILWTVAPRGVSSVTASSSGHTVSLNVTPTSPPPLNRSAE